MVGVLLKPPPIDFLNRLPEALNRRQGRGRKEGVQVEAEIKEEKKA